MVARDQKDNRGAFDDALLEFYEKKKNNKWKTATNDDGGKHQKLKISHDLAGLVAKTLGSNPLSPNDKDEQLEEFRNIEAVWIEYSWITYWKECICCNRTILELS
jgi:hypothetical protein